MAVIDCVSFNGEHDLFQIRYEMLKDYVDQFIVVEFDKTFNGRPKEPGFFDIYKQDPKVTYHFVKEEQYEKYRELAESSPNTVGADHWKREFMQKESIKDCLTHLNDDDLVFIGDCDEIWNPDLLVMSKGGYFDSPAKKINLRVYTYYLNQYSSEEFWGTLVTHYGYLKDKCLNELRTNSDKMILKWGWHFTSLKDGLRQKLSDSYTEESYATPQVMDNLEENVKNDKDFLGRDFIYKVDESQWPRYLKDNKEKYKHLMKG